MNNLKKAMEAAAELGISYPAMIAYKRAGMPCHKQKGRLFFIVEECREWLVKRKENKKLTRAWLNGEKLHEGDIVQDKEGKFCIIVETDNSGKMFAVKYLNAQGIYYIQRKNLTLYARKVKGGNA